MLFEFAPLHQGPIPVFDCSDAFPLIIEYEDLKLINMDLSGSDSSKQQFIKRQSEAHHKLNGLRRILKRRAFCSFDFGKSYDTYKLNDQFIDTQTQLPDSLYATSSWLFHNIQDDHHLDLVPAERPASPNITINGIDPNATQDTESSSESESSEDEVNQPEKPKPEETQPQPQPEAQASPVVEKKKKETPLERAERAIGELQSYLEEFFITEFNEKVINSPSFSTISRQLRYCTKEGKNQIITKIGKLFNQSTPSLIEESLKKIANDYNVNRSRSFYESSVKSFLDRINEKFQLPFGEFFDSVTFKQFQKLKSALIKYNQAVAQSNGQNPEDSIDSRRKLLSSQIINYIAGKISNPDTRHWASSLSNEVLVAELAGDDTGPPRKRKAVSSVSPEAKRTNSGKEKENHKEKEEVTREESKKESEVVEVEIIDVLD
ncbi:hypothetical protein P9112_004854 [Eukaryota sp. TZLM1-RC]